MLLGYGLTYLVLREIPIRNFYARSMMWAIVGLFALENYYVDIFTRTIRSKYTLNYPEHFLNQYNLFDYHQIAS